MLPPNDIVDDLRVTLNNLDYLCADTVVRVVRRQARLRAVRLHGTAKLNGLDDVLLADAADHDGTFIEYFRTLGAGADQYAGEAEHGAFFGECAAVGEDTESIHLQVVVVEESERAQLADQWMELEAALLDLLPAAGMCGIDDRQLVAFRDLVQGVHEREEMAFVVNVLFPVRRDQDIPVGRQSELVQGLAGADAIHMLPEDLTHRRAGDEDVFLADAFRQQVAAAVLGVGQVDVADVVDDLAVDLFRHVLIKAAVAGLHVEDRDLEALGGNSGEGAVGVA